MPSRRRLKYAAYHEAGHTVLAHHFGLLRSVTLEPRPVTRLKTGDDDILCIIHCGGVIAQARYQKANRVTIHLTAADRDDAFLEEVIASRRAYLPDEMLNGMRQQWERTAREILFQRWDLVRAVANSMMQKGSLTAKEVNKLAE